MKTQKDMTTRFAVRVQGIVQGVGFRPFVWSLAHRLALSGFVLNDTEGVYIEVEGEPVRLEEFMKVLQADAPPMARVETVTHDTLPEAGYQEFVIKESLSGSEVVTRVSPDLATCDDCTRELFDPRDRRYRYPFINCTNCGPRFTIMRELPYDRGNTTMSSFAMCADCGREYHDPADRRFHAQPNACPVCGPRVWLLDREGAEITASDPLRWAAELLNEGKILAVKGLGGYHIACDARNAAAVRNVRDRKLREEKPFAIMLPDITAVREYCYCSSEEKALLTSYKRPILLLAKKNGGALAPGIAPGYDTLGVMLPYTPVHHILMRDTGIPLVMTSGNISEEPIAYRNDEARARLRDIADYFLVHDRKIHTRCEDSVTRVWHGKEMVLRRARGYAPAPMKIEFRASRPVLACGAELKNTFCLLKEDSAYLSPHIGDLENLETLKAFEGGIAYYGDVFEITPQTLACDVHPEYLSTKYAWNRERAEKIQEVQHHHAHIVSCMVDNGLRETALGVAFDGMGYGDDGTLWGGEFLLVEYTGYTRLAHLEYVPLPGGAQAIREPWRVAAAYLRAVYGDDFLKLPVEFVKALDREKWEVLRQMIEKGLNAIPCSGAGRLFDAVSSLIGVGRDAASYEGQPAVELEMAARGYREGTCKPYECDIEENHEEDKPIKILWNRMVRGIVDDIIAGVPQGEIAYRFHRTMAEVITRVCLKLSRVTGTKNIVLSGGVFQNTLLLDMLISSLSEGGLLVFTHSRVPPNDGGISLGQAVIAASKNP